MTVGAEQGEIAAVGSPVLVPHAAIDERCARHGTELFAPAHVTISGAQCIEPSAR